MFFNRLSAKSIGGIVMMRWLGSLIVVVVVLSVVGGVFAKGEIVVGCEAPDFELPRLTLTTDADGNPIGKISAEKVKLSSFRGKKPVCLIMSSYT
jgi:hypothetical protein